MITFSLSPDLEMFRTTARDLALAEIRPRNREAEDAGRVPDALKARYVELGFAAVELSEALGGLGQGLVGRVIVEEELAYGDIGIALGMPSPGPYAEAVLLLGTEAQQAALVPPLLERGLRGVIAWSEPKPTAGTFTTIAEELSGGGWRINGIKSEVVLADEAGAAIVFARRKPLHGPQRPAAFHVPLLGSSASAAQVRFGPREESLGLCAAPAVTMTIEDLIVGPEAELTGAGDRFERRVAEMFTRIGLVAASRSVGVARAAFEHAQKYASERQAFGKPIAHFQGLAFLIADMATRVEVMRAMVEHAAWSFDAGEQDAPKRAAMAIAECHQGAMFVTNNAVQVLGGAGFLQDHPVEKWMRDAKAHMAYGMPYQLCDLLVGRLAVEGGPLDMEQDAPMPEIQPVMI